MALYPDEGRVNELAIIAGVGGSALYVRLYTSNPTIDKNVKIGDFVEPTFTGYEPYNSSMWAEPAVDTNDDVFILSPVIVFVGPSAPPGQTIIGFFVTIGDGSSMKLWFCEKFPTPITLNLPTSQIPLQVQARLRYLAS